MHRTAGLWNYTKFKLSAAFPIIRLNSDCFAMWLSLMRNQPWDNNTHNELQNNQKTSRGGTLNKRGADHCLTALVQHQVVLVAELLRPTSHKNVLIAKEVLQTRHLEAKTQKWVEWLFVVRIPQNQVKQVPTQMAAAKSSDGFPLLVAEGHIGYLSRKRSGTVTVSLSTLKTEV